MAHKKKPLGNFLVIGQRGGRYWIQARKHTSEEATLLAKSRAYNDKSGVQNTYHVAEITSSTVNQENYNPRRPK